MATNVVLNGVTYSIPAVGDSGWGASLSSFLVAVPTGVLTKAGGSFALTAGVDFGASYGLSSISYASRNTPATAGVFRLGNTQAVSWRNQANTSNLDLSVNASNVLTFNSVPVLSTAATGVQTFLTTPSSANLAAAVTDETGSGALVFATSPTLVTPTLGTPASGTLTNCTGLPVGSGISGLGSGVATFLATPSSANLRTAITDETGSGALVFATSPTLVTPALGTPSSGILTSCTGLPVSTGIAGLGSGVATFLATPSSANLLAAMTDETGTGALVFATSPTLVTPALGTPSSGTLTSCTGLPIDGGTTGTLPIVRGGTGLTALGSPTQALRVNAGGTALEYFTITGTGDVVGPASSTSDHVVLFDGTTGKLLKGAGFTGSDVGRLSTTQIFTGDKTFQGALTIPGSITMAANTFARSGAHNLTLTTTGTTNVTLPTTGTLAITGANTFTAAQTINTASNQIVLSSGVNQLTLNSGTSAAARTYTVPDVGATGTFAMRADKLSAFAATTSAELAGIISDETGSGKLVFADAPTFNGLTLGGGSAANLSLWSASNTLNLRGGTSGLDIYNTSGTVVVDVTDAGAVTMGPPAGGVNHTVYCGSAGGGMKYFLVRPNAILNTANDENYVGVAGRQLVDPDAAISTVKIGTQNPTGFLWLRAEDNAGSYLWVDNLDNLRISTTKTHIGTSSGTFIGGSDMGYETGTFTPRIIGITTAGTGTYTTQQGTYTRIGDFVFFSVGLTWTAHTGTGNMRLTDLPFTSKNLNERYGIVNIITTNMTKPANGVFIGFVITNTVSVELQTYSATATEGNRTTLIMDTAASLWVQGCYTTASVG